MTSTPPPVDPETLCALHCPKAMRKKMYGSDPWYCDRVKVIKFSYVWNIEKFSNFEDKVVSPAFAANENSNIKWQITMTKSDTSLVLHLRLISTEYTRIRFKFGIDILKSNGERDPSLGRWNGLGSSYGAFIFPRKIDIPQLKDSSKGYLVNDSLILICDMTLMIDAIDSSPCDLSGMDTIDSTIHQGMGHLLESGKFSDITLIVEDEVIHAHKAILSMRSDVFAAMFDHEMLEENTTNQIIIEDFEYRVIKEMLTFIYTNKAPNIDELAAELLAAADKYALSYLKIMCEIVLHRDITPENALHTLVLADLHSASTLRARAIHYVHANYSRIEETPDYETMSMNYISLIAEVESYEGCLYNLNKKNK